MCHFSSATTYQVALYSPSIKLLFNRYKSEDDKWITDYLAIPHNQPPMQHPSQSRMHGVIVQNLASTIQESLRELGCFARQGYLLRRNVITIQSSRGRPRHVTKKKELIFFIPDLRTESSIISSSETPPTHPTIIAP